MLFTEQRRALDLILVFMQLAAETIELSLSYSLHEGPEQTNVNGKPALNLIRRSPVIVSALIDKE